MKKLALTIVVLCLFAPVSFGTSISFELDTEFSGATDPAGTAPWLVATIDDGGTPGSVTLTMSASGLVGTEKVTGWYFNVDSTFASLTFAYVSGQMGTLLPYIQNTYQADGDGKYDILFNFPTSETTPGSSLDSTFGSGETSVWTIAAAGLTANSFEFLSAPAGGHGPFLVAAHVQSIAPSGESGWITGDIVNDAIPEPTTMALVAVGISAFAMKRKRAI